MTTQNTSSDRNTPPQADVEDDVPEFSSLTPEQQALFKEAMQRSNLDVDALLTPKSD